jgi:hypothetical protein
MEPEDSDNQYR